LPIVAIAAALGIAMCTDAALADVEKGTAVVHTTSGRVFVGELDARSNQQTLVLRMGSAGMRLLRPIEWRRVSSLRVDGKPVRPEDLLRDWEQNGWPVDAEELPAPSSPHPAPQLPAPTEQAQDFRDAGSYHDEGSTLPIVRSLAIESQIGRWSGAADNDGILVRIYPLDASGNLVPVDGTLEIDLIGQQAARQTQGEPFPELGRWTQRVSPADFDSRGAVYRFPYQAWHPEFDLQFSFQAVVHARLSVPGHGVFDDTASMVTVRPYSTTRDRLQMYNGRRFFPQERTTRGQNDSGSPNP